MREQINENTSEDSNNTPKEKKSKVIPFTFEDHVALVADILKISGLIDRAETYDGSLKELAHLMFPAVGIAQMFLRQFLSRPDTDSPSLFETYTYFLFGFLLGFVAGRHRGCTSEERENIDVVDDYLIS